MTNTVLSQGHFCDRAFFQYSALLIKTRQKKKGRQAFANEKAFSAIHAAQNQEALFSNILLFTLTGQLSHMKQKFRSKIPEL